MRGLTRAAVVGGVLGAVVLAAAPAASAHPLGNATVNHYDGLHLYPDHLVDSAVEDIAEIPTLQRESLIDTNGDGTLSAAERSSYATAQCAARARGTRISVGGTPLALTVTASDYSERPGAIQLRIGRLTCALTAPAALGRPARLTVASTWDSAGIGWHEITAVTTDVTLHDSPFPAASISDELLHYPNDLLSSPLDVRGGTVATSPGSGASTYLAAKHLPVAGSAVKLLNRVSTAFNDLVGRKHLTVGVGLLAVLLSMVLGAGHAFLPGHGKTIMAAYLVGKRGRLRDVVAVGATVTITHTLGVLALGLAVSVSAAFAPTDVEQDLGILSGLIVAGVGVGLLVSAVRRRAWRDPGPLAAVTVTEPATERPVLVLAGATGDAPHSHDHPHSHDQPHSHDHPHEHAVPHRHGFGGRHVHAPAVPTGGDPVRKPFGRGGLVGLGIAGGLVPSPSALLVLLAAIALGRTVFGVVLVLGYGVGMAVALSVAGLLLVRLRDRIGRIRPGRRLAGASRILAAAPLLTALLVLAVGVLLAVRAAGGTV